MEVKRVPRYAVESYERVEGADDDVDSCEQRVEQHRGDGREEESSVGVGEPRHKDLGDFAFRGVVGVEADSMVGFAQADGAEEGGEVAFFAGGVDEAARGEGCGV